MNKKKLIPVLIPLSTFIVILALAFFLNCKKKTLTISGYVNDLQNSGISGVAIRFSKNGGKTTTDSAGFYTKKLSSGWSGTVTPFKENYDFIPGSRFYRKLNTNPDSQNFIGYGPVDPLAPPTEFKAIKVGKDSVILKWLDNSSREDGYIIRRSIPGSGSAFIEVGRIITGNKNNEGTSGDKASDYIRTSNRKTKSGFLSCSPPPVRSDTLEFLLTRLQPSTVYFAEVIAFTYNNEEETDFRANDRESIAEEETDFRASDYESAAEDTSFSTKPPLPTTGPLPITLSRPTDLEASPRSIKSILLTWKDNSNGEDGFQIQRKKQNERSFTSLPGRALSNSRCYLDTISLDPGQLYYYRVRATIGSDESDYSDFSNKDEARTNAISYIATHTNGFEVDNTGGSDGGWSNFKLVGGHDQLYDGHVQLWTEKNGKAVVYDGDDKDFETTMPIWLYHPAPGSDIEWTAYKNDEVIPVIFKSKDDKIEIYQHTYQKKDSTWIVVDWTVYNRGTGSQNVKLALFLDADAKGELSDRDEGHIYEAEQPKIVYLKNLDSETHIGVALIPDASSPAVFDNYQICNFGSAKTPDNSSGGGENARKALFQGVASYTGIVSGGPADLTITLVSNLGSISSGGSVKVKYAIAVADNFNKLRGSIKAAATVSTGIFSTHFAAHE